MAFNALTAAFGRERSGNLLTDSLLPQRAIAGKLIFFSMITNLAALAMSLFMMQIFDRVLSSQSKDTLFFFTGRYNNLRHSTIADDVDFSQPDDGDPRQRWFDRFAFPDLVRFKPRAYHQIANFVVAREHRGQGFARLLLDSIVAKYSRDHLQARGAAIEHSQHLLCGRGMWQIGDPPWLSRMLRLPTGGSRAWPSSPSIRTASTPTRPSNSA